MLRLKASVMLFTCWLFLFTSYVNAEKNADMIKKINDNAKVVISMLTESDLTKSAMKFLGGVGIIADGLSMIVVTEDPVITKLEKMMSEIRNSFTDLSNQVTTAVTEMKAFAEKKQFQALIQDPADKLFQEIRNFFTAPDKQSLADLKAQCKPPPRTYLSSMNTLLRDNSILIQNAPEGFSDQSFNEISKVFKATTKQLLVSIGVCDNILFSKEGVQNHHEDRYRITLDAIAEIDEHLVNSDTKRKDEYWPEAVLNSSRTILTAMEKEDFGANRKIATTIMEKLKTDYPQWDEFFVGVYKNKLGYKFHSFYGESYELIKDYKGRNTFIFRRPKDHPYKKCDMSKVFNNHACILAKEDTGLLNTLAELLLDKCSEAKFIGVIQESMMLGVAMSNNDAGWFENFHPDCTELNNDGILVNRKHDLSVVVGW